MIGSQGETSVGTATVAARLFLLGGTLTTAPGALVSAAIWKE